MKPKPVQDELKEKWVDQEVPAPWQIGIATAYRSKRLKARSEMSICVTVGALLGLLLTLASWKLALVFVSGSVTVSLLFVVAAIKSKLESIEYERMATSSFKRVDLDEEDAKTQENK